MKVIKNNISKFFIVSLLLGSIDSALASQQPEQKQPEQASSKLQEPVLSEKEIAAYLQSKFAALQVAPDVDVRVIARLIKNGNYTVTKLEEMIKSVQQRTQNTGLTVISREHISDVINNKIDEYFYILLAYSLGVINKRAVAIHESGHTIAVVHLLQKYRILIEVSLFAPEAGGAVTQNINRKDNWAINASKQELIEFYKNLIIMALSGGVADQIFGLDPVTKFYVIVDWITGRKKHENVGLKGLLDCRHIKGDIQVAVSIAQHLNEDLMIDQTIDQILQDCYDKAYQFILDHKKDVEKIADLLILKGTLFGNEVYNLLGIPVPQFDFKEEVVMTTEIENLMQSTKNSIKKKVIKVQPRVVQRSSGKSRGKK